MRLLKIGKKFLKPHRCPGCHKFMWLVRFPVAMSCPACQKRHRRQTVGRSKKYNTTYRRRARRAKKTQPYCALCGSTEHLTCHHTVNVITKEWQGEHLTVLCERCHSLWETKVNKLRNLIMK